MKIRPLVAACAATLLATLVTAPVNVASAVSYNYGTRATPVSAIAGGARFGGVNTFAPVGRPSTDLPAICSTGVPWRLANGTRGFLTAGHCLPLNGRSGAQIIRGISGSSWTAGARLGSRPNSLVTANERGTMIGETGDLAFVPSLLPVGPYLFNGGPTSTSVTRISSWTSKATEGTLCFSGYRTGSRCGFKIGPKTSYRDGARTYHGLNEAYLGRGAPIQRCPQKGDSGGAVYRLSNDKKTVIVVGIISGSWTNGVAALGCYMLYTPLGAAQKQFGGGPIIS